MCFIEAVFAAIEGGASVFATACGVRAYGSGVRKNNGRNILRRREESDRRGIALL
jgi:hypothetical protein